MASFSKLLSSVLIALLYASNTSAAPGPSTSKHATHRTRTVGVDGSLKLETFHPESIFEGFGVEGLDHPLVRRAGDFDIKTASVSFLASKLGFHQSDIQFPLCVDSFLFRNRDDLEKMGKNGVPVANAVANVAFNDDGKVLSFSSSFVKPSGSADETPTVSLSDAIAIAEKALDGTHNGHPATLEFLIQADGSAALTHVIQIQNESVGTWVEAFVDAHSNKVVSVTDFVAKSSYLVLPINKEIPTQGFETLFDTPDLIASPLGWHNDGSGTTTTTSGNNVIVTPLASETSATDNFIYNYNFAQSPTTTVNLDAAVTNAFYVVNTVHDFTYRYGFTESTFNFQTNNFGKGGLGNDRVTVSVQDPAGIDNADFSTPPDGQSGHMRMFLWDFTSPNRDGAIENDIVVHENTHGVTNRMTGGGTGRCLQTTEAGGMGEGPHNRRFRFGPVRHQQPCWDSQPPVLDFCDLIAQRIDSKSTTNPLRYSSLKTLTEVHAIGEVWANILHNVHAPLVTAHGWSANARMNPDGTEGNIVFLHLFLDALLLQASATLHSSAARNAWIQADANRYAGANKCLLWNAFASRGLGCECGEP
ncbi:Fungalysin metallopeptidase-domain-containing protein [Lactarius psammicola]|nr:Fungalysin metallopeptidase-domain-containing protein [Lactarius psammicola]